MLTPEATSWECAFQKHLSRLTEQQHIPTPTHFPNNLQPIISKGKYEQKTEKFTYKCGLRPQLKAGLPSWVLASDIV